MGTGAGGAPLGVVAREWGRIGITGFGGPPAHIALLRQLVVADRAWMDVAEFEAAIAACNLLPGPASTQLAIFCAYRVAGRRGAVVGGLAFVVPAVLCVLALAVLFLASSPPSVVRGAGAGAGAAVAAVAVQAGLALLRPSRDGARTAGRGRARRWWLYALAGGVSAATIGPYLVLVLLGCGAVELALSGFVGRGRLFAVGPAAPAGAAAAAVATVAAGGGVGALAWVAIKVGLLSYGGGFVIVPLMQGDAVHTYHWMTQTQFLNAVALGQVTPGPVVSTITAVGYAAGGVGGGLLAAAVAFAPSFAFVLVGGASFQRIRRDARAQAFLGGAGPAAIGAILGAAVPLAAGLREGWQVAVLAGAALALLALRRGVVPVLLACGAAGSVVALAGGPLPG